MIDAGLNDDFRDLLNALIEADVRFLVVGAHALAAHGIPRATGDLDVWVRADAGNAGRVLAALQTFGAPVDDHGIDAQDFEARGFVYQIGLPPRRIDLLTSIDGVAFDEAWPGRTHVRVDEIDVPFIGLDDLIRNKRATGREKDALDLRLLEGLAAKGDR